MSVKAITKASFAEEVLRSEKAVLVDFWAPWCGPCGVMSPIVDAVAEEKADVLKVCKINIDEELELAQEYRIKSIPTLALFKGGKLVKTMVGVQPREELLAALG
ncbi:MAG: thioredoxin [Fusobacteriaceae bacterium]|jgi:thioredoxin 1|nr:thioredoxin [Fusobacteriaceae bacterium]